MIKQEANIYAIAKEAGVSIATVSRVMNNSGNVSEKSRCRVLDAAKKLNYVPNSMARSLSTSTSSLLGVVVSDINNPFFSLLLKGITRVADEKGLRIFLFNTDEDPDREHQILSSMRENRLKGVIITPVSSRDTETRSKLAEFEARGIPVVLLDRELENADLDRVISDDAEGVFQAITKLINLGHRKIAIITGPDDSRPGYERLSGYTRALTKAGIPMNRNYIRVGNFKVERAYEETLALFRLPEPPTAIFSSNNMTTYGCLRAFGELGLQPGRDIALFGFDDVEALTWLNYRISVVSRNVPEMGEQAMRLLIRRFENEKRERSSTCICLPTELILRGSELLSED